MQRTVSMESVANRLVEKFEDVKVTIVKKFPVIDEHIQKIEKSNKILRNQVGLLHEQLNDTTLSKLEVNERYDNLQKKYEILESRYMRQEGLWEKAIRNADVHQLDIERVLISSGAMAEKLFNGLESNNFGVITARELKTKPFDYSLWEVLYVDGNTMSSIEIKRYPTDSLFDVMKTLIHANSVAEVKEQSIYSDKVGCWYDTYII